MVVCVLVAISTIIYFSQRHDSVRVSSWFDETIVTLTAPFSWIGSFTAQGVGGVWSSYVMLVNTEADNKRLLAENDVLKRELVQREEIQLENARLNALLGLQHKLPNTQMIVAHVIASSPSTLYRSIRIDRGTSDGIRLGAAVLSHEGVVGRIGAVTRHFSDVILVVDPNSSIDVLVQRTRAWARIRGSGTRMDPGIRVEYLRRTDDVAPGDQFITSGRGSVFPKGIPVGQVREVEHGAFGLYQYADVTPVADFSRLETVMVVTSTSDLGVDDVMIETEAIWPDASTDPGSAQ